MTLKNTKLWFEVAIPSPTETNTAVQTGVHIEEFVEMLQMVFIRNVEANSYLVEAEMMLTELATALKSGKVPLAVMDRKKLLDALADQIVTAVGIAHMLGMDICGAMEEVNRSNFSKFVDGEPVFKEGGKIGKGPRFIEPNLSPFV